MRVLVTRPEPDATRTAAALEARGHTALVDPVVAIETLQDVVIPQRAYVRILVTSGNAIRAIEGRPDAARLHGVPLLAVGDRTAALAREAGFGQVESAGGGADTLVVHAAATGTPEAGPILYLAGTNRAGDVDGRLRTAGFEVDLVEVYRAAPVGRLGAAAATALAAGEIDAVLFASRRTAEGFAAAVRAQGLVPALGRVIAAAISAKVAGGLDGLPFASVRVAADPTEQGLTDTLSSRAPGEDGCISPDEDAITGDRSMASDTGGGGGPQRGRRTRPQTIDLTATPVPLPPEGGPQPATIPAAAGSAEAPAPPPAAAADAKPEAVAEPVPAAASAPIVVEAAPTPAAETKPADPAPAPSAPERAAAEPAPQPMAASPPPAPSARGPWVPAMAGGVAGALLVGAGAFVGAQTGLVGRTVDRLPEIAAVTQRVETGQTQLDARLQEIGRTLTALSALEPRLAAAERIAAEGAALAPRVEDARNAGDRAGQATDLLTRAHGEAVAELRASVDEVRAATRSLESRVTQLAIQPAPQPAAAQPGTEALAADIARLRQALGVIDERITRMDVVALQRGLAETQAEIRRVGATQRAGLDRAAGLAVAVTMLKAAIDRGGPFSVELDAVRSLGVEAASDPAVVSRATTGLATSAQIADAFRARARAVIEAATPRAEGTLDRVLQAAGRIVTVRPTGEVQGNDPSAIVARIEARLARGDLVAALAEFRTLPEAARAAAGTFADDAAARIAADRLIRTATDDLVRAMTPRG